MTQSDEHKTRTNHYSELLNGMERGLLLTVNNSGGANAPPSEQLEVINPLRNGAVFVESQQGQVYMLRGEGPDGESVLEEYNGEDGFGRSTTVETIEVIGVAAD